MRIHADTVAAVAVDYQEKLIPAMHNPPELIRSSRILLSGLKELNIPVIISRQYPKGLGDTVPEIKEVTSDALPCEKMTFSCWGNEEFRNLLQKLKRKNIIVCGVEAHVCVLQTSIDLLASGYGVLYAADCTESRKKHDKKAGMKRAEREGALIVTYEQILFELLESATAPAFKSISALLR
ncbi:MAG: hydrolase [Desulfovibrio sp.]|nr:hydrolase [Desulfovibrio sp.]